MTSPGPTLTEEGVDLLWHAGLDIAPPCDGELHPVGKVGHVPDQPARYLVSKQCGHTLYMCEGWTLHHREHGVRALQCSRCGKVTRSEDLIIVSLP